MTMRKRLGRVTSAPRFLLAVSLFFLTAASYFLFAQTPHGAGDSLKLPGFRQDNLSTNEPSQRPQVQMEVQQLDLVAMGSELLNLIRLPLSGPQNFWAYQETWYGSGTEGGEFMRPNGVILANDGTLVVADSYNHRIQVFERSGTFVRQWGEYGTNTGQFTYPSTIAQASDGTFYIVDGFNHRIQVFSDEGTYLRQWGECGTNDSQFLYPSGIALHDDGTVYVADTCNHRIQVFTRYATNR
jgi:DNA-binding beta-propeller fold protein YncE